MKRNMHLYTDFFFFSMFKDDTIISTSFRKRRLKLRFIPMINECILIAFFLCFPQISLSQPLRFPPLFFLSWKKKQKHQESRSIYASLLYKMEEAKRHNHKSALLRKHKTTMNALLWMEKNINLTFFPLLIT